MSPLPRMVMAAVAPGSMRTYPPRRRAAADEGPAAATRSLISPGGARLGNRGGAPPHRWARLGEGSARDCAGAARAARLTVADPRGGPDRAGQPRRNDGRRARRHLAQLRRVALVGAHEEVTVPQ